MAYETDQYGNTYYIPDAQYTGKQGDFDFGSGLSGAASGAGTGAAIGSLFGPVGTGLGALAGGLLGGAYGIFTGTQEQDRARAAEAANIKALRESRRRMEQGFADERSALESQRQLAEQMNPGEALYGTQGRPGLLQIQQAQLAQQMAAQGARNRAALASRGLLGSGMEAATSGALAGQQAGQQAQLQANIVQQYMQQMQARQQQLAQLGLQGAQLSRQQAAARSAQDLGALQAQQQNAQQIAQRNQALLQAGLQGVSTGLGAYQQAQAQELAKTQRQEDLDLVRRALGLNTPTAPAAAAGLPEINFGKPMFQDQAQQAVNFLGGIPGQLNQGLQGVGQAAASGLSQIGQGLQGATQQVLERVPMPMPSMNLPPSTMPMPRAATPAPVTAPPRLSADMRELIKNDPYFYQKLDQQWNAGGYVSPTAGQLLPGSGRAPTIGNPTYDSGPLDVPSMPAPLDVPRRPKGSTKTSSGLGSLVYG